jgi:EAL domain-containing protein (putative c-di-GMP-specific phosphodiesterase class I)
MAVNVSAVQLRGGAEFLREVHEAVTRWNVDPGDIELEVTETALMEATQKHGDLLQRLHQLGAKIAIDDFGTGYSSFKYLTVFPLNRLKLAQELVFGVTRDQRHAAAVQAVIRLARALGINVIAEGVETQAQVTFLTAAGCRQAQGFFYSPPVDAVRVAELLQQGKIAPERPMVAALGPRVA